MERFIYTHPGQAHHDELVAIALILGHGSLDSELAGTLGMPLTIMRATPAQSVLDNKHIWCIDVGESHDPDLLNFDHHQLSPSKCECAMTLVAKHFGLHDDMEELFGWYSLAAKMDTQGPGSVADELGVSLETVTRLSANPIALSILKQFSSMPVINTDRPLYLIIRDMGVEIINYIRDMRERLSYLHNNLRKVEAGNLTGTFLPRDDSVTPGAFGINLWCQQNQCFSAFSIVPDDRGPGYALFRNRDHNDLDFSRVANDDRIHFAHRGGFIAKTASALDLPELLELVDAAKI